MQLIRVKTRLQLHIGALCTIFFLAVYAKMVCPFINSLSIFELGTNLLIIGIGQVLLREFLFRKLLETKRTINLPHYGYYTGVRFGDSPVLPPPDYMPFVMQTSLSPAISNS